MRRMGGRSVKRTKLICSKYNDFNTYLANNIYYFDCYLIELENFNSTIQFNFLIHIFKLEYVDFHNFV